MSYKLKRRPKPNFEEPLDSKGQKRYESLKKAGFGKEFVRLIKEDREKGLKL